MSEEMIDTVFCKKYQKELPAMKLPPLPGPQGKELMETVSQKAFDAWKPQMVGDAKDMNVSSTQDIMKESSVVDGYNFMSFKDIVDYKLPTHPLKDIDIKRIKDGIKNDPFVQHHKQWQKALIEMAKMLPGNCACEFR